MKKTLVIIFVSLFLVGAIQILIYFSYVYKPIDRVRDPSSFGFFAELPGISFLLSPKNVTDQKTSFQDISKTYHDETLDMYNKSLGELMPQSSFVKSANAYYILAGEVLSFAMDDSQNLTVTLKNSTNETLTRTYTPEQWIGSKTVLITLSLEDPKRSEHSLNQLNTGDYVIIKESFNLFENKDFISIEAEILREPKS